MRGIICLCGFLIVTMVAQSQNTNSRVDVLNIKKMTFTEGFEFCNKIHNIQKEGGFRILNNINWIDELLRRQVNEHSGIILQTVAIDQASQNIKRIRGFLSEILNRRIGEKVMVWNTDYEMFANTTPGYESGENEMGIALLEKGSKFYIWLSVAGIAILLFFFDTLFFRHRLTVQRHKLVEQQMKQFEQEKRLIATQSMLEGETAERSRLARDLHDGLGGMLSVVKLNLKNMKSYPSMDGADLGRFDKALEMLDQSIGELRRVAHHMMPESLLRYGLRVSLEDFCRAIPGANFQYLGENPRLDSRLEILIYRCAFELVNNAVRHASATAINVQLMVDDGLVALTVRDNGVGFNPETVALGAGLENIRTRVSTYNGRFNIYSLPTCGTETSIEIEKSLEEVVN